MPLGGAGGYVGRGQRRASRPNLDRRLSRRISRLPGLSGGAGSSKEPLEAHAEARAPKEQHQEAAARRDGLKRHVTSVAKRITTRLTDTMRSPRPNASNNIRALAHDQLHMSHDQIEADLAKANVERTSFVYDGQQTKVFSALVGRLDRSRWSAAAQALAAQDDGGPPPDHPERSAEAAASMLSMRRSSILEEKQQGEEHESDDKDEGRPSHDGGASTDGARPTSRPAQSALHRPRMASVETDSANRPAVSYRPRMASFETDSQELCSSAMGTGAPGGAPRATMTMEEKMRRSTTEGASNLTGKTRRTSAEVTEKARGREARRDGKPGAANELLDRLTSLEAELSPQLAPSRAPAPKDTTPPSPRASGLGSKLGAACGSPNGEQLVPTPPSARPPSSQSPNVGRVLRAREGGVTPRERRP